MADVIWYGAGMIWHDLVLHCLLLVWPGSVAVCRWVWYGMVGLALYGMAW